MIQRFKIPRSFLDGSTLHNASLWDAISSSPDIAAVLIDHLAHVPDIKWDTGALRIEEEITDDPARRELAHHYRVELRLWRQDLAHPFRGFGEDRRKEAAVRQAVENLNYITKDWLYNNYPTWLIKLRDQQSNQRFA